LGLKSTAAPFVPRGIVIKDERFDFETCEKIDLHDSKVRSLAS
jgi:hypothetical protein